MLFERSFNPNKFDYPKAMKKIIEYLESIGRLYITYKEVEEIDNDNSVFLERVKQQYYADTMAYLFLNFYELVI